MSKPTAEQFREMLTEALEDPRKQEIQLKHLDQIFEQGADFIPQAVDSGLTQIYEEMSGLARDPFFDQYAQENPEILEMKSQDAFNAAARKGLAERNEALIVGLTSGSIDPVLRIRLAVNPQFTDFSDIGIEGLPGVTELPGYIKLYEAARDKNVGIAVVGLKGGEGAGPPALVIDLSKTYEQSALIPGGLNPPVTEPEEEPAQAEQQVRQPVRGKRIKHYTIK